jgi:hypothetical protein
LGEGVDIFMSTAFEQGHETEMDFSFLAWIQHSVGASLASGARKAVRMEFAIGNMAMAMHKRRENGKSSEMIMIYIVS